jgi:hypothetical protein
MSLGSESCGGIKASASTLALQLALKFARFREGKKVAGPDQSPGTLAASPTRDTGIVIMHSASDIVRQADAISPGAILEDINPIAQ